MRPISALAVLLPCFMVHAAAARPQSGDTGSEPAFVVGEGDHRFDSASARGSLLVVHYLSDDAQAANGATLSEFAAKSETLAGTRHIFVQPSTPEVFGALAAAAPPSVAPVLFRDAESKAAQSLNLPTMCGSDARPSPCPAVIVFDESGSEIFRETGAKTSDRFGFDALAAKIGEATKDADARQGNLAEGVAIQGFDPVAYIEQGKAVPGARAIESSFRGVKYRFAAEGARRAFNANPVKYLPAYGGWCATAMAKGEKVEIDPKNFKVTSGRLFLFYKGFFGNALTDWNKDEAALTRKADSNWRQVTTE